MSMFGLKCGKLLKRHAISSPQSHAIGLSSVRTLQEIYKRMKFIVYRKDTGPAEWHWYSCVYVSSRWLISSAGIQYVTRKYHIDAQKWTMVFNFMIMVAHEGLYSSNTRLLRQKMAARWHVQIHYFFVFQFSFTKNCFQGSSLQSVIIG